MTYDEVRKYGCIEVGKYSYGHERATYHYFGEPDSGIVIGSFTSIALETKFIMGGCHDVNSISLYPFGDLWPSQYRSDGICNSYSKGLINIGSDVWISTGVTILNGVTIGNGAVIGAGAIVVKDIPPYSICHGTPAKVVRNRFTNKQIELLQLTKWWTLDDSIIRQMQSEKILENYDFVAYEKFMKRIGVL